jgi:Holliday junction resolvase-like predicted endonuclease
MASLKMKGDLAELMVATDLLRRGYKVAFPYGEDWDYDLIAADGSQFHRVQVKHATSDGDVIRVECRSNSLTRGKVKRIKRYTAKMMDWLARLRPHQQLLLLHPGDGARQRSRCCVTATSTD